MKIAVLMGGTSAEREVSLATGQGIFRALSARGHDVVAIDTATGRLIKAGAASGEIAGRVGREPPGANALARLGDKRSTPALFELREVRETEVAFIALHGGAGENGQLQALPDLAGVPYTGSGHLGSALAIDKLVSKDLFSHAGVPTPPWLVGSADASQVESALGGFPVVVKPSQEGSTVGVSLVRTADELEEAIREASRFEGLVLIEQFIPGRELAVGILGNEALPVVEIIPTHEIYDYECKYTAGQSEYKVPAELTPEETDEAQMVALTAHRVLRLSAYSRIDLRMDASGRAWCLEANSLPGMTETSLLPKAAAAAGIGFEELCERLVKMGLESKNAAGTRPRDRG